MCITPVKRSAPDSYLFYEIIAGSLLKLVVQNRSNWDKAGDEVGYRQSKLAKSTKITLNWQSGQIFILQDEPKIEVFDNSKYWIIYNDKILSASTMKYYILILSDLKKNIQSFISKNKLNQKRKKDKIRLAIYLNSMLKKTIEIHFF